VAPAAAPVHLARPARALSCVMSAIRPGLEA
jgi:hypothetical protein